MAWSGFLPNFQHRLGLATISKQSRNTFNKVEAGAREAVENARLDGMNYLKARKEKYAKKHGLPTAESTVEEKAAYRDYIAPYLQKVNKRLINFETQEVAKVNKAHDQFVGNELSIHGSNYSSDEINQAVNTGWNRDELHAGIVDVFNKTADARATALGITRFRGTDEAMDTLGSIGSLFYKDNDHLSGKAQLAIGGAVGAGMIGAAYAAGNPDNWK